MLTKYVRASITAVLVVGGISLSSDNCAEDGSVRSPMRLENIAQGIYDCEVDGVSKYSFDSQDESSNLLFDVDDEGVEFRDINSGDYVRLYRKNAVTYNCDIASRERVNYKNWMSIHIYESIYSLNLENTLIESLSALEIIMARTEMHNISRRFKKSLGVEDDVTMHGQLTGMGHYVVWLHASDGFIEKCGTELDVFDEKFFVFPDRKTDIFLGWGGSVNIEAFFNEGVKGLAEPVRDEYGKPAGSFHGFKKILEFGDPDFAGGFYITDDQMSSMIQAFKTYPGRTEGYSFLSMIERNPNIPFEPSLAQAGNGNNCGHFAFYLANCGGVISREDSEALKVIFYYPKKYFDTSIPTDWFGLITETGIIDKRGIAERVKTEKLEYLGVRVWDHKPSIDWLEPRVDFIAKHISSEIRLAYLLGARIDSPDTVMTPNRFRDTLLYEEYLVESDALMALKLERAGLVGDKYDQFRELEKDLKREYLDALQDLNFKK